MALTLGRGYLNSALTSVGGQLELDHSDATEIKPRSPLGPDEPDLGPAARPAPEHGAGSPEIGAKLADRTGGAAGRAGGDGESHLGHEDLGQ
jgi:hypothetical protein